MHLLLHVLQPRCLHKTDTLTTLNVDETLVIHAHGAKCIFVFDNAIIYVTLMCVKGVWQTAKDLLRPSFRALQIDRGGNSNILNFSCLNVQQKLLCIFIFSMFYTLGTFLVAGSAITGRNASNIDR